MNKLKAFFRMLINNWWLKLLALVLATVSFFAIRGATGYEVDYTIPLVVIVDPGIAVLNQDPTSVRVRFRGSRDDLLRLDQRHLKAVVEPRSDDDELLEANVTVGARNIEGASGVSVVKIEPASVSLTFDREVETTVRVVEPRTIGSPLIGSVELTYEPTNAIIRGPKRRLEEMKERERDQVSTELVDVDGRVESFTKQVRILPPSDAWVSHFEPAEVTVKVSIVTEITTKTWEKLPVRAILRPGMPLDLVFDPPSVDVSLEGRVEILEGIADDSISVLVDCSEFDATNTNGLPVLVHLPCQLEVQPVVTPQSVKASLRKESD